MSTVKYDFHVATVRRSKKQIVDGQEEATVQSPRRIPRVSKLIALAIYCEQMICDGVVSDYRELAELGHVSRARISPLMNPNICWLRIFKRRYYLCRGWSRRKTRLRSER